MDALSDSMVVATSGWFFVGAGWAVSAAALLGYAAMVVTRGRRLSRAVPAEERRWS
jgi:hypothetical protein